MGSRRGFFLATKPLGGWWRFIRVDEGLMKNKSLLTSNLMEWLTILGAVTFTKLQKFSKHLIINVLIE